MVEHYWWNSYSGTVRWNGNGETAVVNQWYWNIIVEQWW